MATIIQASLDTKALMDLLRKVPSNQRVSYDVLSHHIGRNVRERSARPALDSARRNLLHEGIRFEVVRGIGLERMTDAQIAKSGPASIRKVNRTTRREMRKMSAVNEYAKLTNDQKIQYNLTLSALGVVAHMTRPTQLRILQAAVSATQTQLPPKDAVDSVYRALTKKI